MLKAGLIGCGALGCVAGLSASAWGTPPRQDEVRAMVAEVMRDAETRSSLLQGGSTAGHDDAGFFLASADGNYRLNLGGYSQFRYMANFRDDDNTVGEDDFEPGFQMRRMRLNWTGHVVDPTWNYRIEGDFDRESGTFELRDAYVAKKLTDQWTLAFGQIKAHMLREENIEASHQLAVERSVTNSVFSQGRSQAVAGIYADDNIMFIPIFSDGAATQNTDFTNPAEFDWALTGRVNWKFAGDSWGVFNDFTSMRGQPFAGMVGAGVHYQQSANTNAPTDTDVNVLLYTADVTLQGDGWNVFVAGIGRNIELKTLSSDSDFNDFGAVAQGGVYVTDKDELFFRYDVVVPDDDRGSDVDPFNVVTPGWNHYFAGHAAKFTLDAQIALDAITETALVTSNSGNGLLGSSEEGEVTLRAQFQLMF